MARLRAISEIVEQCLPDWDHCHIHFSSTRRTSVDGELISYGVSYDFVVCPSWQCGAPADPGVSSWSRWAREKSPRVLEGSAVRSDEELAAAAIRTVIPLARIEKLEVVGVGRTPDFTTVFPDGSSVAVEVTMHTDSGRRQVSSARYRSVDAGLRYDWYVHVHDQRLLNDYDGENSFPVKKVGAILAAVLVDVEQEDCELDDLASIGERCEREIDGKWQWARNDLLDQLPPLSVSIRHRGLAEGDRGSVDLRAATSVFHFSKVTAVSALVSAVQQCIDNKQAKDQWGDTANPKWLVVVLDGGEAATQLVGVTEFDDKDLDFSEIIFPELDEVWAVAFEDGKITVLRCTRSDPPWRLYRNLPVDLGHNSDR